MKNIKITKIVQRLLVMWVIACIFSMEYCQDGKFVMQNEL